MISPLRRIKALFTNSAIERDMDVEMRVHLDMLTEEYQRSGLPRDEAQRQARLRFGNVSQIKDRSRDIRGAGLLGDLLQDLRYAGRIFWRTPLVFAVIVLSLGVGIGGSTAVFSALNGLFLRTLPVAHPEQLVSVKWSGPNPLATRTSDWGYSPPDARGREVHSCFSYPMYLELRRGNRALDGIFAFGGVGRVTLVMEGRAETAWALGVSGSYFETLGIPAAPGKVITPEDDAAKAPVAMISNAFWRRRFASDPNVIGKTAVVNDVTVTIVGVTPADFDGVQQLGVALPDVLLPLGLEPQLAGGGRLNQGNFWWLQVMGRRKPGVTDAMVQANLQGILQAVVSESQKAKPEVAQLYVDSGSRGTYETDPEAKRAMTILTGIVTFILILVCANVANLLLFRAEARRREISVRLSLGAGRRRLFRQLLTESLLLAVIGGAVGLVIGYWSLRLLPAALGESPGVDWRVFVFTVSLSLVVGVVFGLTPAMQGTAIQLTGNLNEQARRVSGSRSRLRKSLLILQVAISVVLLIGAGLLVRTLQNLRNVDLGFNPQDLLVFRLSPSLNGIDRNRTAAIYEQVIRDVQALPGVRAVSLSQKRLLSDEFSTTSVSIPGKPPLGSGHEQNQVHLSGVAPTFFDTLQIPLVAGRQFTAADNRPGTPSVAIVNETFAKTFFPHETPIGSVFIWKTFTPQLKTEQFQLEIAGIVKDTRHYQLRAEAPPTIYLPYLQTPILGVTFEVRTAGPPMALLPAVRNAVSRIEPNLPVIDPATQLDQIETRFADERVFALSYSLFGALATVLAAIGLFGMTSYDVTRRTHEIGIRLAIGAQRSNVIRMVLLQSLGLVSIGIALGVLGAVATSRLIRSLLFGLAPTDPLTFVGVSVLIVTIAALASYMPARRASRIEPIRALRHE